MTVNVRSESWAVKKRDLGRFQAAQIEFSRSIKDYTRLVRIPNERVGENYTPFKQISEQNNTNRIGKNPQNGHEI